MKKSLSLFLFISSLMLLSSCNKEQAGDPYILFEIHGKVIDADGNPIEGIHISSGQTEVQKTSKSGVFSFYGRSNPVNYVILTFEDKDGDSNGGEFLKAAKDILVYQKTPGSESGNYKGTYFAGDVEVILIKKNEDKIPTPDTGLMPI